MTLAPVNVPSLVDASEDTDRFAGIADVGCLEDVAGDLAVLVGGSGRRVPSTGPEFVGTREDVGRLDVGLVSAEACGDYIRREQEHQPDNRAARSSCR